jgi:hypothetical protein
LLLRAINSVGVIERYPDPIRCLPDHATTTWRLVSIQQEVKRSGDAHRARYNEASAELRKIANGAGHNGPEMMKGNNASHQNARALNSSSVVHDKAS